MKKFLACTLAMTMALGLAACGTPKTPAASTPATSTPAASTPAAPSKLIMGTSADYKPFEFHILEDGLDKIVGFDVALGNQIAEDMGAEFEVADMSFDNLLTLLAKGDCDYVIAAIEATEERLQSASASDPYYTDLPAMILVRAENADQYTSFESFAGKSVGAQAASTKADIIPEMMPGANAVLLTSVNDLVNELVYNKCDAVVLDGAVALQFAATNSELTVLEHEALALGDALPYCVWVAKDDPKGLLPSINATIAKVLSDGTMDRFIAEADELSSQAIE